MISTTNIWVIKFENHLNRELAGLRGSVRIAAPTQAGAEVKADELLNEWLRKNPGEVGSWTITLWVQPRYRRDEV